MEIRDGIGVSPGVTIGRAFVLDEQARHMPRRRVSDADIEHQLQRLETAIAASIDELKELRHRVAEELDADAANILDFHITLLSDPHFRDPIDERIREHRVAAEYAVTVQLEQFADKFLAMDHEAFRSKVSDLWDLDRRLVRHLVGETLDRLQHLNDERIVVAHELTPSQTAGMNTNFVRGFVTEAGGTTSHTSIMARALGIPAVVGIDHLVDQLVDDDLLIIDGNSGTLIVDPDEATLKKYRLQIDRIEAEQAALLELVEHPSVTKDGTKIRLYANIEFAHEMALVNRVGADGVGLFRTEFLFLIADHDPTEEEQYEAYSSAVQDAEGKPVTIRTLDLGSDKATQRRALVPERNPALGCRSIRYSLQNLSMFQTQLRAILRASALGPTRIMFPLITGPLELRQARMVLRDTMEDLSEAGTPFDPDLKVGIMVEAPSAALMAHVFAREVDFMSIGTNDLVQYTLAVDRTNERVANLYSASHPAILKLVKDVLRAGRRQGIEVSLCGEMASDIYQIMLLLGLGLRSLSLVPSAIPDIKRVIRSIDIENCERVARKAGSLDSERQVLSFIRDETRKVLAEGNGGRSVDEDA